MENWIIKNLPWIIPASCTAHGSILVFLVNWIQSKPGRSEFDSRLSAMDDRQSRIENKIDQMTMQYIEVARQNGEMIAKLSALEESSREGDLHVKELLAQLK